MKKHFETIGPICVRGGSKGIIYKNIRDFHGKSLRRGYWGCIEQIGVE